MFNSENLNGSAAPAQLPQHYRESTLADLARSLLDAADAESAGIQDLSPDEFAALCGHRHVGYQIVYPDLDGRPTDFWRLKNLDPPPPEIVGGFPTAAGGLSKPAKPPKYIGPRGRAPQLYFARGVNWRSIQEETKAAAVSGRNRVRLYYCEGEKPAILAAKLGIKGVIATGGCWSIKSKAFGQYHLLDDFRLFDLQGVEAVIIFDSDARVNPHILGAVYALAHELSQSGARVFILLLPHRTDGSKSGLDDLLVDRGIDAFRKLEEECIKDGEFNESRVLWKLNTQFSVLQNPPSILNLENDQLIDYFKFTKLVTAKDEVIRVNSKGDKVPVPAGPVFVRWPLGRQHSALVYEPGQPRDIDNGEGPPLRNLWRGFKWESHPGPIDNWRFMLDWWFDGKRDEERIWWERWAAYPIKFPGTKLFSSTLFYGPMTGSGKSLAGLILRGVYGADNSSEIGRDSLASAFNGWAARKQFIQADEITNRRDLRLDSDKLKRLITQETTQINIKHQPTYSTRDCCNFLFTSNHRDGIFVEDLDRRFFIEEILRKMDPRRGAAIANWAIHDDLGPLLYHFENLSMGDFNPTGEALHTVDRADVIDSGYSDLDTWAHDLKADPDNFLRLGNPAYKPRDLVTLEELASACKVTRGNSISHTALRNALRSAGIARTADRVSTLRGRLRFWIVNHTDRWLSASPEDIAKEYDASLPEGVKDHKY